jgi:DNA-binding MarR family transcriptional regulator
MLDHLSELGRMGSLRDPLGLAVDAEVNLTAPQLHAVMWLSRDGAMSMATLATRIHCTGPTTTGVVDRLESFGLVERQPKPGDRRVVLVALTGEGEEVGAQLNKVLAERISFVLDLLGKKDREQLLGLIGKIVDALKSHVDTSAEEE